MSIFKGFPGNYVEGIYKDYFLSINPDILEENECLVNNLINTEIGRAILQVYTSRFLCTV